VVIHPNTFVNNLDAMVVLFCLGVVLDTRVICKYQCYDLNDQNDSSYDASDLERYVRAPPMMMSDAAAAVTATESGECLVKARKATR